MMQTFLSVLVLGIYITAISGFTTSTISYSRVSRIRQTTTKLNANIYDAWANDLLSSKNSEYTYDELILPLDEESIEQCLEELMESDYGKTMFGKYESINIFVSLIVILEVSSYYDVSPKMFIKIVYRPT